MWGLPSPGSLCTIPVRYKGAPKSHQEAMFTITYVSILEEGTSAARINLFLVRRAPMKKA